MKFEQFIYVCFYLLQIVEFANKKDFTSIIVVHTNRREPGWSYLILEVSIESFCQYLLSRAFILMINF